MLIIVAYFLVNVLCEVSANQAEGMMNIAKIFAEILQQRDK